MHGKISPCIYRSVCATIYTMAILALLLGATLLLFILRDTFETIVLPRTVGQRLSFTTIFYRVTWGVWKVMVRKLRQNYGREYFLGAFGPLSMILLLAAWAGCLILSFALLFWGLGSPMTTPEKTPNFGTDLYVSGTTFFTVGFGDVTPHNGVARILAVSESGVGLGFLAIVIGYLPVLYQSFSRREVGISLLDARAGSPPTAAELLRRHGATENLEALQDILRDWERWAADLLESHLSYPALMLYRSQHDRQSWLATLTTILDTCAIIQLGHPGDPEWRKPLRFQAQLTFAIARHAIIDLALVLNARPMESYEDRLPPQTMDRLSAILASAGLPFCLDKTASVRLAAVRALYEPYILAMVDRLVLTLPDWVSETEIADNWQTSAWEHHDHFTQS